MKRSQNAMVPTKVYLNRPIKKEVGVDIIATFLEKAGGWHFKQESSAT